MRLVIISGHGDALQTAAAAATAAFAASSGKRVLLASVGPLHRLGALLKRQLGSQPQELDQRLAAVEIAARDEIGVRWDQIRPQFQTGLASRLREIGGGELPAFPGMDAVGTLMIAGQMAEQQSYDLLICDGPSMESLLRAIALPDTLRWFVRLVFGLDRGPGKSRISQENALLPVTLLPPASAAPLQDLRVALESQRTLLAPESGARVRVALPISELSLPPARQALGGFGLYSLEVDSLLVHGDAADLDSGTRNALSSGDGQRRPRLLIEQLPLDATDIAGWAERGKMLYRDVGPDLGLPLESQVQRPELRPETMNEVNLHIPFLEARALEIAVASEEVIVKFGPYRRHILLPALISGGRLRARVDGETLRLWVEKQA
jgi:arsenite/tail-anchored protein-transporting ATPase